MTLSFETRGGRITTLPLPVHVRVMKNREHGRGLASCGVLQRISPGNTAGLCISLLGATHDRAGAILHDSGTGHPALYLGPDNLEAKQRTSRSCPPPPLYPGRLLSRSASSTAASGRPLGLPRHSCRGPLMATEWARRPWSCD